MKLKFRIGQNCWIFNGDDAQKEKIVKYWEENQEYEITDGNMYDERDLYKSRRECLDNN